jgi:uncharacterized protein YbcI
MGSSLDGQGATTRGEQAAHISRQMVRLMRDIVGRGPTKARTTIGRDHVLVMFQETLTQGERNVIESGESHAVELLRSSYQQLLKGRATLLIEDTLERKVIGFMSANNFDPDMAAEVFVLEPAKASADGIPQEGEHTQPHDEAARVQG